VKYKKFFRLMLWEFEEIWRSPTLELIAGIAIFFGLSTPSTTTFLPLALISDLKFTIDRLFMFQMLIIAVLFARSIAGSIEKREILIFFTYPVKRVSVLASKFLTNLSLTFIIFASVIIARALLVHLEPWNISVLIVLFTLFLETLFVSTLSLIFSVITKRTWAAMLFIIIFFFTMTSLSPQLEPPFKYLIPTYGADVIFNCLAIGFTHYTFEDFAVALGSIVITSVIFLLASFIYFKRMQVD
jgi:ABC-type transport system involved in multi-copper enzyme maturation permease subunit